MDIGTLKQMIKIFLNATIHWCVSHSKAPLPPGLMLPTLPPVPRLPPGKKPPGPPPGPPPPQVLALYGIPSRRPYGTEFGKT